MKYSGFKKGMEVILMYEHLPELGTRFGTITHSSGQRIIVTDDSGGTWEFSRHGTCLSQPDIIMEKQ